MNKFPSSFSMKGEWTMNTTELVRHVMLVTDEVMQETEILEFLNDGIARINTDADANFPNLRLEEGNKPVFPEKWTRQLLVPYAAGRVKQNDGSQFEYHDLYTQFETNLLRFIAKYPIPAEYKDTETESKLIEPSFEGNPYVGW